MAFYLMLEEIMWEKGWTCLP